MQPAKLIFHLSENKIMHQWVWIVFGCLALAVIVAGIFRFIGIRKYKRHLNFLKKEMKSGREELEHTAREEQHLDKEMAVIKNIYRNKPLRAQLNEEHSARNN
jgi:flagellar biosynthesis/type III secretory pathway M-ring protein FliF/YscJ